LSEGAPGPSLSSSGAWFTDCLRRSFTHLLALAAKPEDWRWSSYRHYQTGTRGAVEIESEWTAGTRGWQLPDWMRCGQSGSSSPVPKGLEGPRAPSKG